MKIKKKKKSIDEKNSPNFLFIFMKTIRQKPFIRDIKMHSRTILD